MNIVSKNIPVNSLDNDWTILNLPSIEELVDLSGIEATNERINLTAGGINEEISLDESKEIKELTVKSYNTLTTDLGSTDKTLVVDKLDLSIGHIKVKGTGTLNIYVRNSFQFTGDSSINNLGDPNQVNLFLENERNIELRGNQKLYASFYGKKKDIYIVGSASFVGNVFTGGDRLEFSGGSVDNLSQVFFVPNGKVKISGTGSGKFRGTIMAKEFQSSGGSQVYFQDHSDLVNGPISLEKSNINFVSGEGNGSAGSNTLLIPTNNELIIKQESMKENSSLDSKMEQIN